MKKHIIILALAMSCTLLTAQQIDTTATGGTQQKIGTSVDGQKQATAMQMQQRKSKWFTIGAKIGYNISLSKDKITDNYSLHTGLRHGGSAGIYMRLGTNWFCQPEVLYSFALYDEKRDFSGDTLSRDMQTHTIDVPVLLGYSPICSETFKFRILVGPRFAFNVNRSDKYNNVPLQNAERYAVSMNKGRLGLDCGIGFDFWRISLDIRYVLMGDIFRYQYLDSDEGAWENVFFPISTFSFTLGYNIWGNNMPNGKKQKYDPTAYDFFRKE